MISRWIVPVAALILGSGAAAGQSCQNPGQIRYHPGTPQHYAPENSRAQGFLIETDRTPRRPPDIRPECLPLPIRYNNPGALQTPRAGPWRGQVGRDSKGHAVFNNLEDGVAAWLTWVQRRMAEGRNIPFKLMSMYAPPNDCIGSVAKLANGQCPPRFPLNDTDGYARRVAAAFGIGPHERIQLNGATCMGRVGLQTFYAEVMRVELGRAFCNTHCGIERMVFSRAADRVFGPVSGCS